MLKKVIRNLKSFYETWQISKAIKRSIPKKDTPFAFEKEMEKGPTETWVSCSVLYKDYAFEIDPETAIEMDLGGRILPLNKDNFTYVTSDGRVVLLPAKNKKASLLEVLEFLETNKGELPERYRGSLDGERERRFSV